MSERPMLSRELEPDEFLQFYYLKQELIAFCRGNGLSTTGGKQDITKRIEYFLKTGERLKSKAGHNKYERQDLNALGDQVDQ